MLNVTSNLPYGVDKSKPLCTSAKRLYLPSEDHVLLTRNVLRFLANNFVLENQSFSSVNVTSATGDVTALRTYGCCVVSPSVALTIWFTSNTSAIASFVSVLASRA